MVASLRPRTGSKLVLCRAWEVGRDALEGLLPEDESSPWASHTHPATVSPPGSTRATGDRGSPNKPKAGLFSKQGGERG